MSDLEPLLVKGDYVLGHELEDFEREFGWLINSKFVIGVNSGTDALILSLLALGIGPAHEVITQANTFNATVAAICFVGARPVLVDAMEDSFLIDVHAVRDAIAERTRAIIPAHLFGKPTRLDALIKLATERNIAIIEDAAQAHGASLQGQFAGTIGNCGCFSFHPSKNLAAAGDAGAVVTSSEEIASRLRLLRALGQSRQNCHLCVGLNSKLDSLQAYILRRKLPNLLQWNQARRKCARYYLNRLSALPLQFQCSDPGEFHAYHLFQIRTTLRDGLLQHLISAGIDAVIRYPTPIHLQPAFAYLGWKKGSFPVSEALAEQTLCLPIRPDLTEFELQYTCEQVERYFRQIA